MLLVYDITNYSSFENLDDWLAAVNKVFSKGDSLPHIGLVGNKSMGNNLYIVVDLTP